MPPQDSAAPAGDRSLAATLYRLRWLLALPLLALIGFLFSQGVGRVGGFSADVASLADTSNGSGAVKPLFFDPSMDIWFGEKDSAVETYYDIEDTFVAEDYVIVSFEASDSEFGVFSEDALATVSRLTEQFLTVPGVRHVRSLTYNPWIRWGEITDDFGTEEGLIISDLVEGDPAQLTEAGRIERMVAVLGAERAAEKLGEARVRAVLGADADFADHIGEPLLLGTILDETGTVTSMQVQVLRPRMDADAVSDTFSDETAARVGPNLSSIEQQRAVLRGIEHFLRIEQGLAVPTEERGELVAWIESLPQGPEREALELELADPNRNFMAGPDGELRRKFHEYDPTPAGYTDFSEPTAPVDAPADFSPAALSAFTYQLGGVPLFERNFEVVGIEDGKYVPLMFLVIAVVLFAVFRSFAGMGIALAVVFASIMGMIGLAFTTGDLLNNLTMMSPNMLTAVGIADAIHLLASYFLLRGRYATKRELITEVVRRNALPVMLTSITTSVGFYSLTVSKLEPVQMLGTMAALGTVFAWALSMTLVPALLSLVPYKPKQVDATFEPTTSRLGKLFSQARSERVVGRIVRGRTPILAVTLLLALVAGIGVSRVEVDSDFRGMFPDSNVTMSQYQWIEDHLGGVGDLEIVFRGLESGIAPELTAEQEARLGELLLREQGVQDYPDEFAALSTEEASELEELRSIRDRWEAARIGVDPRFLERLDAFEQRLRTEMADPASPLAVVTDFISPLDTLRKIHQVQNQNAAEFYRVPSLDDVSAGAREPQLDFDEWTEEWSLTPAQDAQTLVAQYYLQYESGARPGEALWTQLSADRTEFRMQGRVKQDSSGAHLLAFERIQEIASTEFPELVAEARFEASEESGAVAAAETEGAAEMILSGKTLLFARTSDLFARGFVQSMSIALFAITILIGLLYRSWRFAVVSLIPNVLPIVLPLSVFGLLGIPLDGPSILVSTVALGVCVDDTIHFFTKFDRARKAGKSPEESLVYVFTESGAAITLTTVVLIIGFSTLLLSDFAPNFQMGALASLMILLAWFADLIATTAVLSLGWAKRGGGAPTNDSASNAAAPALAS